MHRIYCSEIWGGNGSADDDVCTTGITATLLSCPADAAKGGDIYYFSVCSHDILTRVVLADMRGHGAAAAPLSDWLYELMLQYMNSLDGAGILTELNQMVVDRGHAAISTATVLTYNRQDNRLHYASAGHPSPLCWGEGVGWRGLTIPETAGPANLPLGIVRTAQYHQQEVQLQPGNRLFVYTDGIVECTNPEGEFFDEARLETALAVNQNVSLFELKRDLWQTLGYFAQGNRGQDDCSFICLELNEA